MAGRLRFSFLLPAWASLLGLFAQQNDIPLDRDVYFGIDRNGAKKGSTMHTGLRPLIQSRAELDRVMGYAPDSSRQYYWFTDKLLKSHLVDIRDGGFRVTLDPLLDFMAGQDLRNDTAHDHTHDMSHNGRGFWITGDLGPTVSFQTAFRESQAVLPDYLYRYAQARGVVPGQGRVKLFHERGLDFSWATANLSWSPRSWLNAQVGQGRHFVGNGYRSMLLSDNAGTYPYVKLSALTVNKKLQYTVIHAKLQMYGEANRLPTGNAGESLYYWKRASFHHLSMDLGPLQVALFEATLWNNIDSTGVRPYDAMELNPVIGLNTLVHGFGGKNKQLIGLDVKGRVADGLILYGQYALDDPAKSRYAWQLGGQWFGRIGKRDVHLLLEYDHATPFAYTTNDARMNYVHAGQPLAGPLGAAYSEAIALVDVDLGARFWFKGQVGLAGRSMDTLSTSRVGNDLFLNDLSAGSTTLDLTQRRTWIDVSFAYRMNPHTNLRLMLGYTSRSLSTGVVGQPASDVIYVTLRTGLFNRYYDL
ncbi:MAG: hypothetical protein QM724_04845 [Flavobacteriales bacterium]